LEEGIPLAHPGVPIVRFNKLEQFLDLVLVIWFRWRLEEIELCHERIVDWKMWIGHRHPQSSAARGLETD
jgi:hypothetical protein